MISLKLLMSCARKTKQNWISSTCTTVTHIKSYILNFCKRYVYEFKTKCIYQMTIQLDEWLLLFKFVLFYNLFGLSPLLRWAINFLFVVKAILNLVTPFCFFVSENCFSDRILSKMFSPVAGWQYNKQKLLGSVTAFSWDKIKNEKKGGEGKSTRYGCE